MLCQRPNVRIQLSYRNRGHVQRMQYHFYAVNVQVAYSAAVAFFPIDPICALKLFAKAICALKLFAKAICRRDFVSQYDCARVVK